MFVSEHLQYLILFTVGISMFKVTGDILYVAQVDENIDSLFNRVVYGFHFLGLTMGFIGGINLYYSFVPYKSWSWKDDLIKHYKNIKRLFKIKMLSH